MQRADSMDVDEARMLDDVLGSGVAEKQGALPVLSWKVGIEAPPFVSTNLEAMALLEGLLEGTAEPTRSTAL